MANRILGIAAIVGVALGGAAWAQEAGAGPGGGAGSAPRQWYDLRMMPDPILDQVLLFYLSEARQGMTDIGEVLDTAGRVRADDEYSWTREWFATAERVRSMAEAGERAGHPLGAGAAWLRASAYYRAALHRHPDPSAPEIRRIAEKEVAAYTRAIALLHFPAQVVKIPYEGTTLPGYFFRAGSGTKRAPLLIVHQGRDAWAEDDT
jgi:hypothetical protein